MWPEQASIANYRRRLLQQTWMTCTRAYLLLVTTREDDVPSESVYKIIEIVGTSPDSWEKAAAAAVERASKSLRDLRIAEISELDLQLKDGRIEAYRARLKVSFKFESD